MDYEALVGHLLSTVPLTRQCVPNPWGGNVIGYLHRVHTKQPDFALGDVITLQEADTILRADLDQVLTALPLRLPRWEQHMEEVQRVVIQIAFELGLFRFSYYQKFQACICKGEYAKAARMVEVSNWGKYFGKRWDGLVSTLKEAEFGLSNAP